MSKHKFYDCNWHIRCTKGGKVLWEIDKHNILVDEGERAIGEVFFRNGDASYLPGSFYTGMYRGTISESTTLATVPNEPSGNGYSRQEIERSSVGWPTVEQHEGDWRWISKTITITASGGDIGPCGGAFLCTSTDATGAIVSAIAFPVERTIVSGSSVEFTLRVKLK